MRPKKTRRGLYRSFWKEWDIGGPHEVGNVARPGVRDTRGTEQQTSWSGSHKEGKAGESMASGEKGKEASL